MFLKQSKKIEKLFILCSDHIERALKIYRDSEKDSNLKQEYGYTLSTLGSSYRYLGQYVLAEDCLKRALKIFRSVDSPSKLRVTIYGRILIANFNVITYTDIQSNHSLL